MAEPLDQSTLAQTINKALSRYYTENRPEKLQKELVRLQNDYLRRFLGGGQVTMTAGVQALGAEFVRQAFEAMQSFTEFTEDNDPYGEDDFGAVEVAGEKLFWKIDYYDKALLSGSEDPADPDKTTRVLTIMLAQEY